MRISATVLRILMVLLDGQAQTGHLDPCRSHLPLILPHQCLHLCIIRTGCGKRGAGTRETGRIVRKFGKIKDRLVSPAEFEHGGSKGIKRRDCELKVAAGNAVVHKVPAGMNRGIEEDVFPQGPVESGGKVGT
ncbi:MAG: hypothetical protein GX625_21060, partial [Clostridiaceae bacterium]|nr:hypothetical protein [Clostridiaceae bacterium]